MLLLLGGGGLGPASFHSTVRRHASPQVGGCGACLPLLLGGGGLRHSPVQPHLHQASDPPSLHLPPVQPHPHQASDPPSLHLPPVQPHLHQASDLTLFTSPPVQPHPHQAFRLKCGSGTIMSRSRLPAASKSYSPQCRRWCSHRPTYLVRKWEGEGPWRSSGDKAQSSFQLRLLG